MNHVIRSQWFAPGHTTATEQYCNRCLICAQHARGNIKLAKHDHLPPPSGPFVNMQIDLVHMPPKQVYVGMRRHVFKVGRSIPHKKR